MFSLCCVYLYPSVFHSFDVLLLLTYSNSTAFSQFMSYSLIHESNNMALCFTKIYFDFGVSDVFTSDISFND